MLAAQCLMMAVSVALVGIALTDQMAPWLLLAFTFLIGCGTALHNPSWQASLGDIVVREDIPAAVTLNSMAFNIMRSVGPAVGGVIVAAAGAATAFALNAVSYIPLIIALARWKHRRPPSSLPRESFRHAISAGLRYVAMSPNLLKVISRSFIFGLGAIAILALLPLIVRDLIRGSAITYGLLLGSFGIGAIGGALMNTRLRETFSNETIAQGAFLGFALSAILVALSQQTWLTCLCLPRRRLLGAGALAFQCHGAAFHPTLGGRAYALDIPDGDLWRHGCRKLAVGRCRRGVRSNGCPPLLRRSTDGRCRNWPAFRSASIWCTKS